MTKTGAAARPALEPRSQPFMNWVQANTRLVTIATVGVAIVALGGWLYARSNSIKAQRADQALVRAEQTLSSGNAPLAQTDLQKIAVQYRGAPAATQAAILLAQIHFDKGEYQKGLDVLKEHEGKTGPFAPVVDALMGDGYEQVGKHQEAAQHYLEAADASRFDVERASYRASAARAFSAAGKYDDAKRLWGELAADPTGPLAAEARVRLGELMARTTSQS
jgi:predicted negative regulator of RcsB-dependent stress response